MKNQSDLPRNWGLPFSGLKLHFQNRVELRKFSSVRIKLVKLLGVSVS